MTTAQAIAAVSQQEAITKLLGLGYTREPCGACKGVGHHTDAPANGDDWKRWVCETCRGEGKVWRAPLVR